MGWRLDGDGDGERIGVEVWGRVWEVGGDRYGEDWG